MSEVKRGKFITLEGPEGGGKTTQAKLLIPKLQQRGYEVLYTREPGGTPTGESIREILQHDQSGEPICDETEVLLFAASRAQLVRNVIIPALERGAIVVCDRFADSTTAYQGYGRGFPLDLMQAINTFAIQSAIPDVTLLLDITSEDGMKRLQIRHKQQDTTYDRIEREAMAFHHKVRSGYLEMANKEPHRFRILDANRDPDVIEEEVWKIVQDVLFS